jgi:hypothetical protein
MKPILRSYLIEIPTGSTSPGAGSQIYINDYPQLRGVFCTGVAFYDNNVLATGPSGKTTSTQLNNVLFTAVDKFGQEIIKQAPARDLAPYYNYGFYRDFRPFELNLVKSYINNTAALTADRVLLLNVFYYTAKDLAALNSTKI